MINKFNFWRNCERNCSDRCWGRLTQRGTRT